MTLHADDIFTAPTPTMEPQTLTERTNGEAPDPHTQNPPNPVLDAMNNQLPYWLADKFQWINSRTGNPYLSIIPAYVADVVAYMPIRLEKAGQDVDLEGSSSELDFIEAASEGYITVLQAAINYHGPELIEPVNGRGIPRPHAGINSILTHLRDRALVSTFASADTFYEVVQLAQRQAEHPSIDGKRVRCLEFGLEGLLAFKVNERVRAAIPQVFAQYLPTISECGKVGSQYSTTGRNWFETVAWSRAYQALDRAKRSMNAPRGQTNTTPTQVVAATVDF